jgi:hypothetical protein
VHLAGNSASFGLLASTRVESAIFIFSALPKPRFLWLTILQKQFSTFFLAVKRTKKGFISKFYATWGSYSRISVFFAILFCEDSQSRVT